MAELADSGPLESLGLPMAAGDARLAALPAVRRMLVAPFAGGPVPAPAGQAVAADGGRIVWAGLGQWLYEGAAKVPAEGVAVTDQSDAWAGLALDGTAAPDVLARLVPIDLGPAAFPPGSAARSMLGHVPLLLVKGEDGFELLVPRSYARTAVEELATAMRGVAARAALTPGGEGL